MLIKVNYQATSDRFQIMKIFNSLPELIACDFETSSRWSEEEKALMKIKQEYEDEEDFDQEVNSDGLSHPSLTMITHLSIATSNKFAYVIICTDDVVRALVYKFLVTTDKKQIWHNALFDFKHILFNTLEIPKNYEDTMLLQKCRFNNADNMKCKAGLKQLEGHNYGDWGISKELEFDQKNMFNERMLLYAATDACATYNRYEYLTKKQEPLITSFVSYNEEDYGYPF